MSCSSSTASTTSTPPRQLRRLRAPACALAGRAPRPRSSWRRRPASATERARASEIRRSLDRLGVDRVDLIQLHNLVEPDEWETALRPGGALEAAVEARDEGLVRFIGVTGHGLPVADDAPAQPRPLPVRLGAAAVQLRPDARRRATAPTSRRSPLRAPSAVSPSRPSRHHAAPPGTAASRPRPPGTSRCASRPTSTSQCTGCSAGPEIFLNTVGDVALLPKVLDAASRYQARPSDDAMHELATRRKLVPLFS